MISAIILSYQEADHIRSIIEHLSRQKYSGVYEIILADGGSTDRTVAIAQEAGIKVVSCRKGKACQLNDAVQVAQGDILFFLHADMRIEPNTFSSIEEQISKGFGGGGFANVFDRHNEKIKRIGSWMNFRLFRAREQSDKGIFYGDNGIFVKKEVFEALEGFKEIPIMEDFDFSNRMRQHCMVVKIRNPKITVSARRHTKAGFFKTRFQWIAIRVLYQWGASPWKLASWYGDVR